MNKQTTNLLDLLIFLESVCSEFVLQSLRLRCDAFETQSAVEVVDAIDAVDAFSAGFISASGVEFL